MFTVGICIYLFYVKLFIDEKEMDELGLRYYLAPIFAICFVILIVSIHGDEAVLDLIKGEL